MNLLYNESCGEEAYIYLDNEGQLGRKIEVYVRWDADPSVKVLLTCHPA